VPQVRIPLTSAILLVAVLAGACAPSRGPSTGHTGSDAAAPPPINRTLDVLLRNEPGPLIDSLAGRAAFAVAMFTASLTGTSSGVDHFPCSPAFRS
jgi:hypothetical protein